MQQHPIPQHVTGYKFHLIGDMTLKQFLELAAGIVTAWIIFSSNINFLIKWTLGPLTAFLGFALAFIPLEDRPLDQWIINFFKAIYKPTQFIFQAKPKKLAIFTQTQTKPQADQVDLPPPHQLEDYLQTLPATPASTFDQAESKYLDHISNLFGALGVPAKKILTKKLPDTPIIKSPVKGVRVRKLMKPQMCLLPHAAIYKAPVETKQASMPSKVIKASTNGLGANAVPKPTKIKSTPTNSGLANAKSTAKSLTDPAPACPVNTGRMQEPTFAKDVILPQTPDKPNLLAGITLDKAGKIIGSVILEIRDSKNHPVRALKSNKLGQFFISTPLPDGIYQIQAEHSDHRFAIMKLEAKNEVIPPLKIQAN